MRNRNIKRLLCIVLSIMLVMSNMAYADTTPVQPAKYADIAGSKYEAQIREWISFGFINGFPDGSFKPQNKITRAEFIAMTNRAFGFTETVEINYSDVTNKNWYYKEAAKATKAGYIQGANGKLLPNDNISRQEVAAILARLTMNEKAAADEKVLAGLTDSKDLAAWGKSAVSTGLKKGFFAGFIDKAFKPAEKVSRVEALVALDRAYKSNHEAVYSAKGAYGPASGKATLMGDVAILAQDVSLSNTTIQGDLILRETIGEGNVYLDNVTVMGETIVKGGGAHSIVVKNSKLNKVTVIKEGDTVRIVATGTTSIETVDIGSNVKLEEDQLTGEGFNDVVVLDDLPEGTKVIFDGNFEEVAIDSANIAVSVESGTIGSLTLAETAEDTTVNLAKDAKVETMTLDVAANVTGTGTIGTANINASGTVIEQKPETVKSAPEVVAQVAGTPIVVTPAPVPSIGVTPPAPVVPAPVVTTPTEPVEPAPLVNVSIKSGMNTVALGVYETEWLSSIVNNPDGAVIGYSLSNGNIELDTDLIRGKNPGTTTTVNVTASKPGFRTRTISFTVNVSRVAEAYSVTTLREALAMPGITAINLAPKEYRFTSDMTNPSSVITIGCSDPRRAGIFIPNASLPTNIRLADGANFVTGVAYTNSDLGAWVTDRTEPLSWEIANDWITLATKTEPANNWYAWHGKKTTTNNAVTNHWKVETEIQLTEELLARNGVRTSMWLNVLDPSGASLDWSILQFKIDNENQTKGWQYWDSDPGVWVDITGVPTTAGTYKLITYFDKGIVTQYINGSRVNRYELDKSLSSVKEVIFNSYSFGQSYAAKWKVPTVNNVEIYPLDAKFIANVDQLKAAIANQADGQTWVLLDGTYELASQLVITKAITVKSIGNVIIKATGADWTTTDSTAKNLISINAVTGLVKLENLTISNAKRSGINVWESTNVVLINITSKDNAAAGLVVCNSAVAANNLNTSGNGWYGVNVDTGSNPSQGAPLPNFTLTGTGVIAEDIQIISDKTTDVTVTATGYTRYTLEGTNKTIWNNKDLKNVVKITKNNVTKYYPTIQGAIADAVAGDTVTITAGTYGLSSQLNINNPITIIGQGEVIIKATNSSWSTDNSAKHLIGIFAGTEAAPVRITNVTFDADGKSYGVNTYNNAYGILNDVTIKGSKGAGVIVNGSTIVATNLNTTGNTWGAVNVDPGSGVTTASRFTLNGGNLTEGTQIWSDGRNVGDNATVAVTAAGYNKYQLAGMPASFIWTNRELSNAVTITRGSGNNAITTLYGTLQAAINAAEAADTVVVAPGTYTGNITVNKQITLEGAANNSSIINGKFQFVNGSTGSAIDGFTINIPASSYAIECDAGIGDITITDNIINATNTGIALGVYLNANWGDFNTVTGNTFTGEYAEAAITVDTGANTTTEISGNVFNQTGPAVKMYVTYGGNATNIDIDQPECTKYAFADGTAIWSTQPLSNVVGVVRNNIATYYPTLKAAVAVVQDNDIILVGAGTYNLTETLVVNESIKFIGAGADKTIINAPDKCIAEINANNVTLEGIQLKGQWGVQVKSEVTGTEVKNCSIILENDPQRGEGALRFLGGNGAIKVSGTMMNGTLWVFGTEADQNLSTIVNNKITNALFTGICYHKDSDTASIAGNMTALQLYTAQSEVTVEGDAAQRLVAIENVSWKVTDAVVNSSIGLNNAIASAAEDAIIRLAGNIDSTSFIKIDKAITIEGRGFSINKGIKISANNVTINDAMITPSNIEGEIKGIYITGTGVVINHVTITGAEGTEVERGIIATTGAGFTVTNSTISNVTTGIYANALGGQSVSMSATGNTISRCDAGIGGTENTILGAVTGNIFTGCSEDIGLGGGVTSSVTTGDIVEYLKTSNPTGNSVQVNVVDYRPETQKQTQQ